MGYEIEKTEEEWRAQLTPEEYGICRLKGTERAFSGRYNNHKEVGSYLCKACGEELFRSETKYDSGSGWPSFHTPASETGIEEARDTSHGMVRVEVMCSRCGAHLGHVFPAGPHPTGLRYCINSVSLDFQGDEEK